MLPRHSQPRAEDRRQDVTPQRTTRSAPSRKQKRGVRGGKVRRAKRGYEKTSMQKKENGKNIFLEGATKRFRSARLTGDKATEAHSPGSTESSAEGSDIVAMNTPEGKPNCDRVEVMSCCKRERRLCYITSKLERKKNNEKAAVNVISSRQRILVLFIL